MVPYFLGMEAEEMAGNYDKIAGHWAGEKFNIVNGMEQHRRALKFLKGRGAAIDLGCGSSGRFIGLMAGEGFESVEGLDFSEEMVKLAREKSPGVEIHYADVCEWEFSRKYDFISGWDGIWHVPLVKQEPLLEKICGALAPGGVSIFTTGGLAESGDVTNPFLGVPLYTAALGIPKILEVVARSGCIVRHLEYDQYPEIQLVLVVQKTQ
jgi:SAM-dependent methyltransferase|tara:strand:+ start:1699 stop:2325 length:627 start_codon:yes stop_codon:yes gene_type:complete